MLPASQTNRYDSKGEYDRRLRQGLICQADHMQLSLRYSECSWPSITVARSCGLLLFFRTPRSAPHFTTNRVSNHYRTCAVVRAAIKRPKTRADPVAGGRTPRLSRTDAVRVWGSPWDRREPPENWVVGCETRGREEVTHAISL